jgi:uncharacterized protein (UPF0548 family)
MFCLCRPAESQIRAILADQRARDFSYPDVGATRGELPAGYAVLRGRVDLGQGSAAFASAMDSLLRWKMFDVPGVRLCWPDMPIQAATAVAVLVRHVGFWSINCCRIVYVIDADGPIRRFGFAYGTLPEHAEQGEERFKVEWNRGSNVVSYDILSFSRPGNTAVKFAHPVARWLQKRFLRNSLAAMVAAVPAKR